MTNSELKEALLSKEPVILRHTGDAEYKCVNAIRYTVGKHGEILVQAELLDKNGGAIVICNAENLVRK